MNTATLRSTDAIAIAADLLDPPRLIGGWRARARPDQLPPDGLWTTLLLRGGRGSGKTWAGAHILAELIQYDPLLAIEGPGTWAIVAPTFADARDKCVEGESGLLAAFGTTAAEVKSGRSRSVAKWNRSLGEVELSNGQQVRIDGADDGAYRIQGENLRGVWGDEVGLWRKWAIAWDESIAYALRKGEARSVLTGTPKRDRPARVLVKRLIADPEVVDRVLRTRDNWANLSEAFRRRVMASADTELGRQELEGIMLEEAEGALWRRDWIEAGRVVKAPVPMRRLVLALDPSDGGEQSDEQAWCLAGAGLDGRFYVADSEGMRVTPLAWLKAAVHTAHEVGAIIVAEKNHGGQFLLQLLEQAMSELGVRVGVKVVHASDGKRTRAEPVSMLYEQGFNTGTPIVCHIGSHPELEDQMANFTGAAGEPSPDRLDALVWALAELSGDYGIVADEVVIE